MISPNYALKFSSAVVIPCHMNNFCMCQWGVWIHLSKQCRPPLGSYDRKQPYPWYVPAELFLCHFSTFSSHRLTFTVIGTTPFSQDSLRRRLFASEELHKIKYYPHGKKPSSPPCEPVMNAGAQLLSHKWHDKCLALGKSLLWPPLSLENYH